MKSSDSTHVAVLMGGIDQEREISLKSGENSAQALEERGYQVTRVDAGHDLAQVLSELKPDVALNMLHGPHGEGGIVQGVLESLSIPYTHSGVAASVVAIRKDLFRRVLASENLPIAPGVIVSRSEAIKNHVLPPPYIVKPIDQGSSLGVILVDSHDYDLGPSLSDDNWVYGDMVLAEKFIPGCDLTCGIFDGKALDVMSIDTPSDCVFNYALKYYDLQQANRSLPALLKPFVYQSVQSIAERVHHLVGCRGVSRVDFRFDNSREDGEVIVLEINTQPGMSNTSMLPEMGRQAGLSFSDMVDWMVRDASCNR